MHFAAQTHVDNSFEIRLILRRITIKALTFARNYQDYGYHQPLLHVSTDEVYGESSFEKNEANTESTSLLEPTNPYSAAKPLLRCS